MSEYDEPAGLAPEEHDGEPGADDPGVGAGQAAVDAPTADGWEAPTTGVPAVDEVLAAVQALDGRPVEDHVAVFEQAHDRLRRALDPGHG